MRSKQTMKTFDWNHAYSFLIVAQQGSFSKAAKVLNVNQSTLSRQIAQLEKELSLTLFSRIGRGIELTQSGLKLFTQVQQMQQAAFDVSFTAASQEQTIEGDVCISATELDALFHFPNIIANIKKQAPNLNIELLVSNDISDLNKREADIAVRYQRPKQQELIQKKIGNQKVIMVGHQDYIKNLKPIPKDNQQLTVIGYDQSNQLTDYLDKLNWQLNKSQINLLCKNQMVQVEMIKQQLGIALLPEEIAKKLEHINPVFEQQFKAIELEIWLVCHQELKTSRRIRLVFDQIAEYFSKIN